MPFRGYFTIGDPRTNVFAAGGARWPTVPPLRWRLGYPDAHLAWTFLRDPGVLFEPWGQMGHDSATWEATEGIPPDFCSMRLTRTWLPLINIILWWWRVQFPGVGNVRHALTYRSPGAANVNLTFWDVDWAEIPPGFHDADCTFHQVEYDQTNPPGGWPP